MRLYVDHALLWAVIGLMALGYVMVTSASLHLGERLAGDAFYYPRRQLANLFLGIGAGTALAFVPLTALEKSSRWLFLTGIALLVLVLLPGFGREINGSVRWLVLGGVQGQVSEWVKWVSVVYLAGYIARHRPTIRSSATAMLTVLTVFAVPCALLLLQPDFGSAAMIIVFAAGMMFLAGARIGQFLLASALVFIAGAALVAASGYRVKRFLGFLHPWEDPLDSGFQLTQSLIAMGRGEWFGVGLGASVQKLFYLPEGHTDFLFAVIAEELGLVGTLSVIALFSTVIWRAFHIGCEAAARSAHFAAFLVYGVGFWFGLQAFINMGVTMGLLPTKGLTLPLMSYGGSSLVVMCMALGSLFRVHHENAVTRAAIPKRKQEWLCAS